MNAERTVTDWLNAQAPTHAPAGLIGETIDRIAAVPQERVLWRRPLAAAHRGKSRSLLALVGAILAISVVGGLGVVGGMNILIGPSESSLPTTSPPASPSPEATASPQPTGSPLSIAPPGGGRIAFSTNGTDPAKEGDIYLVTRGQVRRIVGSDADSLNERCPALSADGTQLAYGQARGTDQDGHTDAALVIADLDDLGNVIATRGFGLSGSGVDESAAPPCAIWSPDGQWLAFGVAVWKERPDGEVAINTSEVRIIPVGGQSMTSLPVSATDLEWSPDSSQLAVASGVEISIYPVAMPEPHETLSGTQGATQISWSPDGQFIAYQRGEQDQLVVHDIVTGENHVLASGFSIVHGIGPVWSPAGDQIVYQRVCNSYITEDGTTKPCREQSDVVLLEAGAGSSWRPTEVTERLMPPFVPDGHKEFGPLPSRVTWSPDGDSLLYATFFGTLVAVPVSGDQTAVVLAQHDDMSVHEGGFSIPIQIWGVQPAVVIPSIPAESVLLEPGTHTIAQGTWTSLGRFPPMTGQARFTLPAGWSTDSRGRVFKGSENGPSGIGLQFGTIKDVYADPCSWSAGAVEIQPGSTRSGSFDVATALAGDETTLSRARLGSDLAYHLTLAVPATISDCDNEEFRRWNAPDGRRTFEHRAGQIDEVWIVDPDRESIVLHTWYFAGTTAEDRAELQGILESLSLPM